MLGQFVYTAAMTIGPEREGLFNEVYDTEHVPELLRVPGMISISRYRRTKPAERFYLAVYEIDTPDVPTGEGFLKGRDVGRWPTEIRPHTRGLRNALYGWRSGFGGDGASRVAAPFLLFARILPSVAAQPDRDAVLGQALRSLASTPGVTVGALYAEVADGSQALFAGLEAGAGGAAHDLVAPLADVEIYEVLTAGP